MNVQDVRTDTIIVGTRKRPIDEKKVLEIAKSIEQQGLLQPIGVTAIDADEHLVIFGAHRVEAFRHLGYPTIPAFLLPSDCQPEVYQLMELQENCARNDLTGAQRKAFAAEIGRLSSALLKSNNSAELLELGNSATGREIWITQLAETSGIAVRTLTSWWGIFCKESGLSIPPRQALDIHKEQFFDWLEEQKRQEDEAKRQQDEARKRRIQQEECAKAVQYLLSLAQEYGVDMVRTEVIDVFYAQYNGKEAV